MFIVYERTSIHLWRWGGKRRVPFNFQYLVGALCIAHFDTALIFCNMQNASQRYNVEGYLHFISNEGQIVGLYVEYDSSTVT